MSPRTVVLLPAEDSEAGQDLWALRRLFAPAELHLRDASGRFLTGPEARQRAPWSDAVAYEGTLIDALDAGRVGLVISLLGAGDGSLQGFLEFAGVTYVGCGLTAAVLARDPDFWKTVANVEPSRGKESLVAVLGSRSPVASSNAGPEAEAAALACYQHLGLAGWALLTVAGEGQRWAVRSLQVQPSWQGAFGDLIARRGRLEDHWALLIDEARATHAADAGLRVHYKDRI